MSPTITFYYIRPDMSHNSLKICSLSLKYSRRSCLPLRFSRGLKTLQQMKKSVLAGKAINEEDIPPEVVVKSSAPQSPDSGVASPSSTTSQSGGPPEIPPKRGPEAVTPTETPMPSESRKHSASSLPHSVAFPSSVSSFAWPWIYKYMNTIAHFKHLFLI